MELNLEKFNIRNSKPIILGNAGLPKNTERYVVSGMGVIGIDLYKDDDKFLYLFFSLENTFGYKK